MSIQTIEFAVKTDSISPQSVTPGGTQSEHNPVKVKFNFDSDYLTRLFAEKDARDGTLYYRFDVYDGEGGLIRTDSEEFTEDETSVAISLTENITRYGGTVCIYVVFTIISDDKTVFEDYTDKAQIILKDLPDSSILGDDTERESLTTLAEVAKAAAVRSVAAADSAENDAEIAESAKEQTESARFALEHGAQFIFYGGDAERRSETDIIVDTVLSSSSENPIANKAVYNALLDKATPSDINEALENLLVSSEFNRAVFLANHKVGDIYVTLNSNNPAITYTGTTWELVGQGRTVVGVGSGTDKNGVSKTFTVGNNTGEYEHTLVTPEMPAHDHQVLQSPADYSNLFIDQGDTEYGHVVAGVTNNKYTESKGGSQPHNNIQPSYAVYLWKRLS